jgi:hypothetical protein
MFFEVREQLQASERLARQRSPKAKYPGGGPRYSKRLAVVRSYSFKEFGSERFFGDFLLSVAINS